MHPAPLHLPARHGMQKPPPTPFPRWVRNAAVRFQRTPPDILVLFQHFTRGTPFSELATTTGLSVEDLNWLFTRPWKQALRLQEPVMQSPTRPSATYLAQTIPPEAPLPSDLVDAVQRLLSLRISPEDIRIYMRLDVETCKRIITTCRLPKQRKPVTSAA